MLSVKMSIDNIVVIEPSKMQWNRMAVKAFAFILKVNLMLSLVLFGILYCEASQCLHALI